MNTTNTVNPRVPKGFVIIEVDKTYKETMNHGKLELEIGVGYAEFGEDKAHHATTKGSIISLPDTQSEYYEPELSVGDKVYFHYNAIRNDVSNIYFDNRNLHRVQEGMIFCSVDNGVIKMIGGRCLCSSLKEEGQHGHEVVSKSSEIVIQMDVKHSAKKAVLRHIGSPLTDWKVINALPGDVIYYEPEADFENIIEGETYFVMLQEDIICKVL